VRRVLASVLALLALAACGSTPPPVPPLAVVATATVSDHVRDLTIWSPAIGGEVAVRLILPPGFGRDPAARYPVLYLLHGSTDSPLGWTRSTDVETLVAGSPVLVVMPDGGKAGFYTDWRRGPHWETFHTAELWRILQEKYQAVVHTRLSTSESAAYEDLVRRDGGADPADLWGDPLTDAPTWAAHNPYDLAESLKGTRLFLSVGNGLPGPLDPPDALEDASEAALHAENEALAARLTELKIPFQLDDYGPGTHTWPYWEREFHRAWPMLRAALTAG
jgi:diacylglycerol O-acyltransferase / trehalose O-mycolyltransferase